MGEDDFSISFTSDVVCVGFKAEIMDVEIGVNVDATPLQPLLGKSYLSHFGCGQKWLRNLCCHW